MGVCKVSVHLRVYLSVQALYGTANALYWKSFVRQNSTHLTLLKYQNTKTALYKLHKNHWVFALFEIFGSVRKKITCDSLFGSPCICVIISYFSERKYWDGKPSETNILTVLQR